jgi:hypothetical protein
VVLVITEVSEEHITSIIGVTKVGELGTTLAVATNRNTLHRYNKKTNSVAFSPHTNYTDQASAAGRLNQSPFTLAIMTVAVFLQQRSLQQPLRSNGRCYNRLFSAHCLSRSARHNMAISSTLCSSGSRSELEQNKRFVTSGQGHKLVRLSSLPSTLAV